MSASDVVSQAKVLYAQYSTQATDLLHQHNIHINVTPTMVWTFVAVVFALVAYSGNLPWFGDGFRVQHQKNYVKNHVPRIMKRKGPIFRVTVFGRRFVFVCDANAVNAITHTAARNRFSQPAFRHKINLDANILGTNLHAARREVTDAVSVIQNAYLGGTHAADVAADFRTHLKEVIEKVSPVTGGKVDMTEWSLKVTFYCSARALFGDNFPAEDAYPHFRPFDQGFYLLARKMGIFAPAAVSAREVLVTLLSAHLRTHLEECAQVVQQTYSTLSSEKYGLGHNDICRFMLILLWGSNVNSVWLHTWALILTGTDKKVLGQLRKEMDAATANGGELSYYRDATDFSSVPTAGYIADESLRWGAANMSFRLCIEDAKVAMKDGKEFQFRKDDFVLAVPWMLHHDKEHWVKPNEWAPLENIPDNEQKEKTGKLKMFLPWGMGQGICPGRKIAAAETRLFVATVFEKFDFVEGTADPVPEQDWLKKGLGFMPPTKNWHVQVRKRVPTA